MAATRKTCSTKGQPIFKPSQWSGGHYDGITSACPEPDVDPGPCVQGGEMKYQLAECSVHSTAHAIHGIESGDACYDACNEYHKESGSADDPNPYMTWSNSASRQVGTCNCFTGGAGAPFSMNCANVLFKAHDRIL